uniref:Uncharacterized protein n=1 Tax=Avena sativa TaxID=4498 RepID=A0ACD5YHG3_AVESA
MVFLEGTGCGALLRELQQIWTEVGEGEGEKSKVLSEIERECLEVYRRKVDDANRTRVQLHQSVATKEAEVALLMATLGEHKLYLKKDKSYVSLREQLAAVAPVLDNLKCKKEERVKQYYDIQSQIEKILSELSEPRDQGDNAISPAADEHDLSTRKLSSLQAQLSALKKDKSDRLQRVLEYVNEVHSLCGVLGIDFGKTVNRVHPSLYQNGVEQSRNISNSTLEGLASTIANLKAERKSRVNKMRDTMESLCQLWKIMDSSEEEKRQFSRVISILITPEEGITSSVVLNQNPLLWDNFSTPGQSIGPIVNHQIVACPRQIFYTVPVHFESAYLRSTMDRGNLSEKTMNQGAITSSNTDDTHLDRCLQKKTGMFTRGKILPKVTIQSLIDEAHLTRAHGH